MSTTAPLQRLLAFLSPAFPVGGFAWSAGLETAIADGRVVDATALREWIAGALTHGGLRTDAIVLAEAHRAAGESDKLQELADLLMALTPAAERLREATLTGDTFRRAVAAWPLPASPALPDPCPYPVAVGALAAAHGIALGDVLLAFLGAAVHAQVSVAVRLVPLGQTDGLRVVAALEPAVAMLAADAAIAQLADIGTASYAADIAQMRHETLEPRIFRS